MVGWTMAWTSDPKTASNSRHRRAERFLVVATAVFFWAAPPQTRAAAEDDLLQKAIDYVFTGTVAPENGPEIVDRKSCIVVVRDPKWNRFIRYYLARLRLDDPNIDSTYSGRHVSYQLDFEGDKIVVEYLDLDKKTVTNGYRSAQIPLPGDIDQTKKALRVIAERCKQDDAQKPPF
jgi:hypothetical protein